MSTADGRIKTLLSKANEFTNDVSFQWFRYDRFQDFIKNPTNSLGYIALQKSIRVGLPNRLFVSQTTVDTDYQFWQPYTDEYLVDIFTKDYTGYDTLTALTLIYQTDSDIIEAGLGSQGFSEIRNMTNVGDMPTLIKSRWQMSMFFSVVNEIPQHKVPLTAEIIVNGKIEQFAEWQISVS